MESIPETARPLTSPAPALARKRRRQEKGWEDSLLASSSSMWERSHRLLWITVLGSTFLDFSSTFYALGLSGRPLAEGNILARFALDKGGFGGLAVWDLTNDEGVPVSSGVYYVSLRTGAAVSGVKIGILR